jgi:hypothetical protein
VVCNNNDISSLLKFLEGYRAQDGHRKCFVTMQEWSGSSEKSKANALRVNNEWQKNYKAIELHGIKDLSTVMIVESQVPGETVQMTIESYLMKTHHQGTKIPLFSFLGTYPTATQPHTMFYAPVNNSNAIKRTEAAVRWIRNAASEILQGIPNQDIDKTFTEVAIQKQYETYDQPNRPSLAIPDEIELKIKEIVFQDYAEDAELEDVDMQEEEGRQNKTVSKQNNKSGPDWARKKTRNRNKKRSAFFNFGTAVSLHDSIKRTEMKSLYDQPATTYGKSWANVVKGQERRAMDSGNKHNEDDSDSAGTPERGSSRKSQTRNGTSDDGDSSITQDTQQTIITQIVSQALLEMEAKMEAKVVAHGKQMQAKAAESTRLIEERLQEAQRQNDETMNLLQREKDQQIRLLQNSLEISTAKQAETCRHFENLLKQVLVNQQPTPNQQMENTKRSAEEMNQTMNLSFNSTPNQQMENTTRSAEEMNQTMNLSFNSTYSSVASPMPISADLEPDISTINLSMDTAIDDTPSQQGTEGIGTQQLPANLPRITLASSARQSGNGSSSIKSLLQTGNPQYETGTTTRERRGS